MGIEIGRLQLEIRDLKEKIELLENNQLNSRLMKEDYENGLKKVLAEAINLKEKNEKELIDKLFREMAEKRIIPELDGFKKIIMSDSKLAMKLIKQEYDSFVKYTNDQINGFMEEMVSPLTLILAKLNISKIEVNDYYQKSFKIREELREQKLLDYNFTIRKLYPQNNTEAVAQPSELTSNSSYMEGDKA